MVKDRKDETNPSAQSLSPTSLTDVGTAYYNWFTHIRVSGGSYICTIPKPIINRLGLAFGSEVLVSLEGYKIIIVPKDKIRVFIAE